QARAAGARARADRSRGFRRSSAHGLSRHHVLALDAHRPGPERAAGAGAGDALAAADPGQAPGRAAEEEVVLAGEVAVGQRRERQASVRAAVDVAEELPLLAHHEAEKEVVALAEHEALGARVGDVAQRTEARARRGLGGIAAQGSSPKVAFQGRISTR